MIRPATPGDADAIWAILEPVFRAGDTYAIDRDITRADALAYWLAHDTFVLVEDGDVLGTYYLRRNQQGGGSHVANAAFATTAAAQGKGVARRMLTDALARATDAGFAAMQFNFVVETNIRALRTWLGAGFREVGRLPGAFDHPTLGRVDALVLYRPLA